MVSSGMTTQLGVEEVEQRLLLAGNVVVNVNLNGDGDLGIEGDSESNQVSITQVGGFIFVTGQNGTTLSTETSGSVFIIGNTAIINTATAGFTDDLKINMGDGDDTVSVTGLTIPDDLGVNMGAGNDSLTLNNVTVLNADGAVNRNIELGDGNDKITIINSSFAKNVNIETGAGNDTAVIFGGSFGKSLTVDGGDGFDVLLYLGSPTVGDKLKVEDFEFSFGL